MSAFHYFQTFAAVRAGFEGAPVKLHAAVATDPTLALG
jgi:hypothetical protein